VLWTGHDDLNRHFVRYRRATLRAVAERAGLGVLSQRYFFHWLFPVKLGLHALERLSSRAPVPAAVPDPRINSLLLGLSRVEQATVAHLGLPFGSSLLAWCAAA